jgi:hypothetical protein
LKVIELPASLLVIGEHAFSGCENLTTITFAAAGDVADPAANTMPGVERGGTTDGGGGGSCTSNSVGGGGGGGGGGGMTVADADTTAASDSDNSGADDDDESDDAKSSVMHTQLYGSTSLPTAIITHHRTVDINTDVKNQGGV